MNNDQKRIEEYKEVGNNLRHYSTATLTLFSIYIAITTAFLYTLANLGLKHDEQFIVTLSAFLCTLFFLVQQISANFLWGRAAWRAKEIEKKLKYKFYSQLPLRFRIGAWSIYLVFLFFSSLWMAKLISLFKQGHTPIYLIEFYQLISDGVGKLLNYVSGLF